MARAKKVLNPDGLPVTRTRDRRLKQVFHLDGEVEVTIAFYPDNRPRWTSTQDRVNVSSPGVELNAGPRHVPIGAEERIEMPLERPGTDEKIKRVLRSGGRDFLKASGYEEQREAKVNPNKELLEAAGLDSRMLDPAYLSGLPGAEGVSDGTDDEN